MRIINLLFIAVSMLGSAGSSVGQPETRIAFLAGSSSQQDIWLADPDGGNMARLTEGIQFYVTVSIYNEVGEPTLSRIVETTYLDWSPDGRRIAFGAFPEGGGRDIFIMGADGENVVNLTWRRGGKDDDPSWAPDGRRIAFVSNRDGNDDIFAMNGDGTDPVNLTSHSGVDREPSWSPDGQRIAFASFREGSRDIYVMDADGGNLTRLTDDGGTDSEPEWSPDGQRIAFAAARGSKRLNIWAMDADGSNLVKLTRSPRGFTMPTWSPDGSTIAFVATLGTGWPGIRTMNADGTDLKTIIYSETENLAVVPSWSPFLSPLTAVEGRSWGQVKADARSRKEEGK